MTAPSKSSSPSKDRGRSAQSSWPSTEGTVPSRHSEEEHEHRVQGHTRKRSIIPCHRERRQQHQPRIQPCDAEDTLYHNARTPQHRVLVQIAALMPTYRVIVALEIEARTEQDALDTAQVCASPMEGMYAVPPDELCLLGRITSVTTPTEIIGIRIQE